ncbi:MAG TPA: hypothetical protein VJ456_16640 [Acidimicrobiia bacterium]|nr:hypothetical protein [Acidimicrobiia bacterium]
MVSKAVQPAAVVAVGGGELLVVRGNVGIVRSRFVETVVGDDGADVVVGFEAGGVVSEVVTTGSILFVGGSGVLCRYTSSPVTAVMKVAAAVRTPGSVDQKDKKFLALPSCVASLAMGFPFRSSVRTRASVRRGM